jgi:hypothetical protein
VWSPEDYDVRDNAQKTTGKSEALPVAESHQQGWVSLPVSNEGVKGA